MHGHLNVKFCHSFICYTFLQFWPTSDKKARRDEGSCEVFLVMAKTAETCGRCRLNVQCSEVVFAVAINTDVALLPVHYLQPNTKHQTPTLT